MFANASNCVHEESDISLTKSTFTFITGAPLAVRVDARLELGVNHIKPVRVGGGGDCFAKIVSDVLVRRRCAHRADIFVQCTYLASWARASFVLVVDQVSSKCIGYYACVDTERRWRIPVVSTRYFALSAGVLVDSAFLTIKICASFILVVDSVRSISIWNYPGMDAKRCYGVPIVSISNFTLSAGVLVDCTLLTVGVCAGFILVVNGVCSKSICDQRGVDT